MNLEEHPHRRYNILTGEWILVSPHRTKRPWQGKQEEKKSVSQRTYDKDCYLCPGNTRSNGKTNPVYTSTYVFDNDFPALLADTDCDTYQEGLLRAEAESGICRVVCFSPNHSLTLPLMSEKEIYNVVTTWISEYSKLGMHTDINYVQIFENKGELMGCSNPHPHGQIWAQRSIPDIIIKKTRQQRAFQIRHKQGLLLTYLRQELKSGTRIVHENKDFVALVPFWAVWPYEIMVLPKKKYKDIKQLNVSEKFGFAEMVKHVTTIYDNLFKTPFPYSMGIHQCPTDGKDYMEWHFHMLFYPPLLRSATVKKFMVGYEMFAGPQRDITAEMAATTLRNLSAEHYSLSKEPIR